MNKQYNDIIIPEELNIMINKTIKKKNHKKAWLSLSAIAATLLIFTTSLNVSPAFAESVSNMPVISHIASLLTFTTYNTQSDELSGKINYPNITIDSSNDTYINETIQFQVEKVLLEAQINAEEYKEAFMSTGGTELEYKAKNMSVRVDYEIYRQDENYVSFRVYSHESLAAVYASNLYFTVDLNKQMVVTLESLLGDDYLDKITHTVLKLIKEDAGINPNKYFENYKANDFTVRKDIDFYLNDLNHLIIVFEKYEIAAGAYGRLEFEIPMK